MDNTICFFELPAEDIEAAKAFYGELFSWAIEPSPSGNYLFIHPSQERRDALGGGLVPRAGEEHRPTVFVAVESIDATLARAEQLGAKILLGKKSISGCGHTATIVDPQGNTIGLYQRDPGAGSA